MKCFPQESEIKDLILNQNVVSFFTEPKITESFAFAAEEMDIQESDELYYTKSILATTTWNKNDDIFLPEEVWAARKTPVNKPTNLDHDQDKIIGHITSQWIIDIDGEVVDDSSDENMPEFFHICNGAVIYKYLPKRNVELSTAVEGLIEQIQKNEKFVSMEALFRGFDYAIIGDGETSYSIVERKSDTAFLSKYLRAYGGEGFYHDKKIGRILRKISFSGKGYVDRPANPDSIIFSFANLVLDFNKSGVYNSRSNENEEYSNMSLDLVQKQLDETKAELESMKKAKADLEAQVAKVNVEKYETEISELKSQLTVSQEKVENLIATKAENEKTIETLNKEKVELSESLASIRKESVVAKRVGLLVEAGIAKDMAVAKVEKFVDLNDEQFQDVANTIIDLVKATASTQETEVEQESTEDTAASATQEVLDNVEKESESATAGAIDDDSEESARKERFAALEQAAAALFEVKKRGNK